MLIQLHKRYVIDIKSTKFDRGVPDLAEKSLDYHRKLPDLTEFLKMTEMLLDLTGNTVNKELK